MKKQQQLQHQILVQHFQQQQQQLAEQHEAQLRQHLKVGISILIFSKCKNTLDVDTNTHTVPFYIYIGFIFSDQFSSIFIFKSILFFPFHSSKNLFLLKNVYFSFILSHHQLFLLSIHFIIITPPS